jgi:hypothetical protein
VKYVIDGQCSILCLCYLVEYCHLYNLMKISLSHKIKIVWLITLDAISPSYVLFTKHYYVNQNSMLASGKAHTKDDPLVFEKRLKNSKRSKYQRPLPI